VVDSIKFVLFSPLWDLIVETRLDLGDHSEWIRVERYLTLCELHNGDVGILCGWPNFKKKSCVAHFDLLSVLVHALFLFRVRPNPKFES
jgi:hypothetical protein